PAYGIGMALVFGDGTRPGDDDGVCGDDQGRLVGGANGDAIDEIENGSAAGEEGSGGQDRAGVNDGTFVYAAIAADEDVVLDDDGAGVDGLEDSADLGGGAEVDALADLRTGADESVGIHHGAFIHPGAGVDVHGRHADYTARHVSAGADGGAAGNDADAVGCAEMPDRVGVLVDEGKA